MLRGLCKSFELEIQKLRDLLNKNYKISMFYIFSEKMVRIVWKTYGVSMMCENFNKLEPFLEELFIHRQETAVLGSGASNIITGSNKDLKKNKTFLTNTQVRTFGKVGHVYDEFGVAGGWLVVGVVEAAVAVGRRWRRHPLASYRPVAIVHGGYRVVWLLLLHVTAAGRWHVHAVPVATQISAVADAITMSHLQNARVQG